MRDMVVLINLDNNACCTLAKMLRSEHIYCKVLPASTTGEQLSQQEDALGVILIGGVTGQPVDLPTLPGLLKCNLPLLALGDAALTLCQHLGGELTPVTGVNTVRNVQFTGAANLLSDVQGGERYLPVCRYMTLPTAAEPLAVDDQGTLGFQLTAQSLYAMTFLPELHDPDALQIINFCHLICGSALWWSNQAFIDRAEKEIELVADGGEALCALSGGIDSAVCAMLGSHALGLRLHCIYIDTGLMREGESDMVMSWFQDEMGLNIKRIDASADTLELLKGVVGTEAKQRIVFAQMRAILRREAAQLPNVRLILQGTNFADTLDSEDPVQQGVAKSHIRIIEPVRELFKDEIRSVGATLQLPDVLCQRQPFPASGLALRILADVTPEKLAILRAADAIFSNEIEAAGLNKRLFQYYASLCDNPIPDEGSLILLRAVQVVGGGESAVAARLPNDLLERATTRILKQLPGVRRVMYDQTPSQSFSQWRSE